MFRTLPAWFRTKEGKHCYRLNISFVSLSYFCHQHAETKGLAPELMEGIMGILKKPSGGSDGDGDGAAGGGINIAAVMGLIGSLTNRWLGSK